MWGLFIIGVGVVWGSVGDWVYRLVVKDVMLMFSSLISNRVMMMMVFMLVVLLVLFMKVL